MPIIYTYPSATPTANDLLIFSDVSATDPAKDTRKCTIGDLVTLIGALVPGGGTVTSVGLDFQATGLTTSGGASQTIITTGVFTVGGTLVVANGGTGANTFAAKPLRGAGGTGPITAGDIDLATEVTHVLAEGNGGTGESTYVKGDILYCDTTGANLTRLPIGAAGEILSIAADIPKWVTATTGGLVTSVDVSGGSTGLVFTGGPITTTGTITLASGQLVVANGGTGAATLTDGGILLGSGTSPITVTAQPTNGQVLIGSTGNDPVLNTLTAGTNISVVNTAGVITIASTAGAPLKVNYDNQLSFKGGTSGTYVPNVARLATYWTLGSFCYLEWYMEWNTAHGCVGTIIMEGLPLVAISPIGASSEQGSCLITVNSNMGTSSVNPAPLTGRPGVTAGDEIIFRNHTALGIIEDSIWTDINPEPVGNYVFAGTATWLIATA